MMCTHLVDSLIMVKGDDLQLRFHYSQGSTYRVCVCVFVVAELMVEIIQKKVIMVDFVDGREPSGGVDIATLGGGGRTVPSKSTRFQFITRASRKSCCFRTPKTHEPRAPCSTT